MNPRRSGEDSLLLYHPFGFGKRHCPYDLGAGLSAGLRALAQR